MNTDYKDNIKLYIVCALILAMYLCLGKQIHVLVWVCTRACMHVHVCMCVSVHVCECARVHVPRDKKKRKKRKTPERSGFFPIMQHHNPPPPPPMLVAHNNALIMRSKGHPIMLSDKQAEGWPADDIPDRPRWPPRP